MANQQEEVEMGKPQSIYAKLRKIQVELKAPKSQYNGFGKYSYRNQEDILEAVKPLLSKHDLTLTISDDIRQIENRYYVEATVTIYDDDEKSVSVKALAREEQEKKGMDGAQVTGASSSYARKYALNGMFNIDDTKDADAGQPHQQPASNFQQQRPQPKPAAAPTQKIADVTTTPTALVTDTQLDLIVKTLKAKGYDNKDTIVDVILTVTKSPSVRAMTKLKADNLLERLKDASKEQIDAAYEGLKNPHEHDTGISEEEMQGYRPEDI